MGRTQRCPWTSTPALSAAQQRFYRHKCSIAAAPLAGFIYLILNPRLTWIRGTIGLWAHVIAASLSGSRLSVRELSASYRTRYWKNSKEYRHMLWNNLVLLVRLGAHVLVLRCGTVLYHLSAERLDRRRLGHRAVHGAAQFRARLCARTASDWDYDTGAIQGTSFLVLPGWLNFFTANIGYHHIHHLSSSIPSYHLVACHNEYQHLFPDVVRVKLSEVCGAMKCILWDIRAAADHHPGGVPAADLSLPLAPGSRRSRHGRGAGEVRNHVGLDRTVRPAARPTPTPWCPWPCRW